MEFPMRSMVFILSVFAAFAATAALSPEEVVKVRAFLKDVPRPEPAVDWENYAFAASRAPLDPYSYTKDMLEFTKGVSPIGNLPHRHA